MPNLLSIRSLRVRFPDPNGMLEVVHGIDLEIKAGQIHGLIGESGSGKSVASQAIGRLQSADYVGSIHLTTEKGVVDLLSLSEKEIRGVRRKEIAYIFQEPMTALNPLMRCGDQIAEGLALRKNKRQGVQELLQKVEIRDPVRAYDAYPHELSGGQRQRVMIAMALARTPRLLIADEPTTALDIAVQGELLALLKRLAREDGLAILFITHDLLSLQGFADHISVMYKGHIMESGPASSILGAPQHPYTRALLQSRASYDKRGMVLAEMGELLHMKDGEYQFMEAPPRPLHRIEPGTERVIEVKGLQMWHEEKQLFHRKRTQVLHSVDLSLYQGDILGIVGESGSGKSTIAKILLGLWKAKGGELMLYGKPLDQTRRLGEQLQLVFQDPYSSLNPKHRIGAAILEVLRSREPSAGKTELNQLLEMVGLEAQDGDRYPHEFSGGQRQRICIARALAKSPRILVLDEAVAALDVSVQARILNLLNDLKIKNSLSYILISHDMNVVSYFCNRILVLRQGEVIEFGETEYLVKNAQNPYTRSLLEHSIH